MKRTLPWDGVVHSCAYHLIALGLVMGLSRLIALQPRVATTPTFERSQVIYYQPSEYLPPIDTRGEPSSAALRADPEISPQPIISVPSEPDNREQTIVTPPKIKLNRNVALPNIVAWSDAKKPRLEIPPVPLTPAAEITRLSPRLSDSAVTPPPDPARLRQKRDTPLLLHTVVAPPPEVQAPNLPSSQILQSDSIASSSDGERDNHSTSGQNEYRPNGRDRSSAPAARSRAANDARGEAQSFNCQLGSGRPASADSLWIWNFIVVWNHGPRDRIESASRSRGSAGGDWQSSRNIFRNAGGPCWSNRHPGFDLCRLKRGEGFIPEWWRRKWRK